MSTKTTSQSAKMPQVYYSSALKMRAHRSRAPFINRLKATWDPAWLDEDAYAYNSKLAIAALGLCMSSYANLPSNDYRYITETLTNFGFRDIDISSYAHRQEEDSSDFEVSVDLVAYAFARFDVPCKDGHIAPGVVCIVRGTSPTIEWNSNANLADSVTDGDYSGIKYVEGFRVAELEMLHELRDYLRKHNIDQQDARFLTAGHSRGACIANILGADLDAAGELDPDNLTHCGINAKPEHVYAYTFASSGTTLREDAHDKRFGNVFNLVYPEDFIPRVPLASWGFNRFGTTCYLPSIDTSFDLFKRTRDATYAMFQMISDTTQLPFHGSFPTDAFVRNGGDLCGSLDEYYTLRHIGLGRYYTFREYFELFTQQCANHGLEKMQVQAKLLAASRGAYGPFLGYFIVHEALKMTIPFIHAAEAYMSRLMVLDRMAIGPAQWQQGDVVRITIYGDVDIEVAQTDAAMEDSAAQARDAVVGRIQNGKCDAALYKDVESVAVAVDDDLNAKMAWVPADGSCEVRVKRSAASAADTSEAIDVYCTCARLAPEGETIVQEPHMLTSLASDETRTLDFLMPAMPTLDDDAANPGMAMECAASASHKVDVPAKPFGPGDAVGIRNAHAADVVCARAYDDGLSRFLGWYDDAGNLVCPQKKYVFPATDNAALTAKFKL